MNKNNENDYVAFTRNKEEKENKNNKCTFASINLKKRKYKY